MFYQFSKLLVSIKYSHLRKSSLSYVIEVCRFFNHWTFRVLRPNIYYTNLSKENSFEDNNANARQLYQSIDFDDKDARSCEEWKAGEANTRDRPDRICLEKQK